VSDGELRVASWREALDARPLRPALRLRARRARRRPGRHRGRLRLRQVRPRGPRHERRRLPRPSALGRGGRLPRGARASATSPETGGVTYEDLSPPRAVVLVGLEPEDESPIVFLRLRRLPQGEDGRLCRRPRRHARPGQARWHPHPDRPRHRARGPPGPRRRAGSDSESGDALAPPRTALREAPSSSSASGSPPCPVRWPPRPSSARPPAPAWPGSRVAPVSAVRSRPVRLPTLLPGGRPVDRCCCSRRGCRALAGGLAAPGRRP
jgi:hypothetical protein